MSAFLPGQHRARLEHIPANLITGRSGVTKSRLLQHLLSLRPVGEHWACLVTEADQTALPRAARAHSTADGVTVAAVTGGCICCSGSLEMRTTLVQLIRSARPQRVLIEAPAAAHSADLVRALQDSWLAPVLDLRAVILVVDAAEPVAEIEADDSLAHTGTVVIDGASSEDDYRQQRAALWAARLPRAEVIDELGRFDAALLDRPGPVIAPRFHRGEPHEVPPRD